MCISLCNLFTREAISSTDFGNLWDFFENNAVDVRVKTTDKMEAGAYWI